jgi:hypothetical protein
LRASSNQGDLAIAGVSNFKRRAEMVKAQISSEANHDEESGAEKNFSHQGRSPNVIPTARAART